MKFYHGLYLKANTVETANVRAYFHKNKSWIRDTLVTGIELDLEYQKLRFDLYKVYARKFNTKINNIRYDYDTRYNDLESIGDRILNEIETAEYEIFSFDDSYSDDEMLKIWKHRIDGLLNANE